MEQFKPLRPSDVYYMPVRRAKYAPPRIFAKFHNFDGHLRLPPEPDEVTKVRYNLTRPGSIKFILVPLYVIGR